jgi:hypothetical protein
MLQMFQLFHMYVANVLSKCFKNISGFCTCCNVTTLPQLLVAAALASCMLVEERRDEALLGIGRGKVMPLGVQASPRSMRGRQV